jgi:hypothetical protein
MMVQATQFSYCDNASIARSHDPGTRGGSSRSTVRRKLFATATVARTAPA